MLDDPVHTLKTDGGVRIHAPAPSPEDIRWEGVFAALRTGDVWGSSYTPTGPEVWALIRDEVSA